MFMNLRGHAWASVYVALGLIGTSGAGWAADRYCATRYMPSAESACFDTMQKAEAYIRTEPASGPIGNSLLEKAEPRDLANGRFIYEYRVRNRELESFLGDFYSAGNPIGRADCGVKVPGVIAPDGIVRCDDEQAQEQRIKAVYGTSALSGSYLGAYNPEAPLQWEKHQSNSRIVKVTPVLGAPMRRTYRVVLSSGATSDWSIDRWDWYQCPAMFFALTSATTTPPKWPLICANTARGTITRQSDQYDSCCKDGNPVVAATGNKEYRESDFDWEGISFSRAYNSVGDLPFRSGLTDHWSHTFSLRMLMSNSVPGTWIRADGYFDRIYSTGTDAYGANNRLGVTVVREPDDMAAVLGRWRLSSPEGLVWLNDAGRVVSYQGANGRTYSLEYCAEADLQAGICLVIGDLMRVRSPSGRTLTFNYSQILAPSVDDNGVRLTGVNADGVVQVQYAYDTSGRLTHASKGGLAAGEGAEYRYAEAANMCRRSDGGSVVGCDPVDFPMALTGVVDENGDRTATYSYDELGRVSISEHAGGAGRITLTYNADGSTTVLTSNGATKRYAFSSDVFRQPTAIALSTADDSNPGTTTAAYANMRRQWSRDARGNRTNYTYVKQHEASRLEGLTPDGGVTAFTRTIQTDWSEKFSLPVERRTLDSANILVAKSKWTYNDRGQVLSSTQVDPITSEERVTTSTYCKAADVAAGLCPTVGALMTQDGPRTDLADVTSFSYYISDDPACAVSAPHACAYRKGDLWKVTNALGQVTEYLRYDGNARPVSSKDPDGVVTDLEYTPRGWLAARKVRGSDPNSEADDAITRYEYDLIGQVKKVVQPDGSYVRYEYDAAHRLTDIYDAAGNQIHYTLDAAGNRIKEDTKDASGVLKRTLSRIYNQLGQLKTGKTAEGHPTGYTYDADGNGDVVTDALGRKTDSDYDPLGRLAKTLQDVGGINAKTEFKYDAQDRLVRVTDPKNLNTDYGYNGFGDLVRLSSPDTGVSTYTYDSAGNRKTATDARGITQTYSYDALNRVTSISYPTSSLNVSYAYDSVPAVCAAGESFTKGRLALMIDGSGSTQYCYDRFGNMVRKVQTTNGRVFTVQYGYTLTGQVSSLIYPDGAIATYQRDSQGRIVHIDAKRGGVNGTNEVLLSQASYHALGPVAGWAYGNGRTMSRPVDLDYRIAAVTDSAPGGLSMGFGFDAVGNIDKLLSIGEAGVKLTYDYDALSRLINLRDGPTGTAIESYTYDATGNRLTFSNAAGSQVYTYAVDSHRLARVGLNNSRDYDASGNSIQIDGKLFAYNDAGRNSEVKQGDILLQRYSYNGRGEQVRKYDGVVDRFVVYDEAGHWLGEYDAAGKVIQQAIWMGDLPAGLWVGSAEQQVLHYVEPDHLGTPRAVVEPSRNLAVWTWDLKGEAFGNGAPNDDVDADGISLVFDMRFPGQRYDKASGLNYNYFRGYEASTGRYIESDPMGMIAGVDTYSYASSRPLGLIDPYGMSGTCPVSPSYLPGLWNDGGYIQLTNNCYSYAADRPENPADQLPRPFPSKPQPGEWSGRPFTKLTCSSIIRAAIRDGMSKPDKSGNCPSCTHKVYLVIAPDDDYHWYRQDQGGLWSHKPGNTKATNLDASGKVISDPALADRNYKPSGPNYSKKCGALCASNR